MSRRSWWVVGLAIAVLAVAASANSVGNGFAYDDVYMLEDGGERMGTLAGWWREFASTYWPRNAGEPGDGYRPLTILAFKLQWIAGAGSPFVFHAVNVVLHVMTSVAVLWLAAAILPPAAAGIAAALYAVHPVHTEAIANVVGQSELVVALLLVVAMALYLHGRRSGVVSRGRWVAIAALYAASMFFKEHAITLIALIPLAELTVVRDRASWRDRAVALRTPMLALLAVVLGYLWARSFTIAAGTGFKPFILFEVLNVDAGDRILTMIGLVPEWVRLFLWPARLTTEYTPPYVSVAQGPGFDQLPGFLLLAGILGVAIAAWRRNPATTFGIGWIVVTLLPASNFVFPAGFIIAERTLLLPSVGAMIAVASAVPWLYERIERRRDWQVAAAAGLAIVVALGVARSVARNRDWKDTFTLMQRAVEDTPENYRAHFMLGILYFERGNLTVGERHFQTALRLFPYDPHMLWTLAERYRSRGFCAPALRLYESFYSLMPPATARGLLGYSDCLIQRGRPAEARAATLKWLRLGGSIEEPRRLLARARAAQDSLAAFGRP